MLWAQKCLAQYARLKTTYLHAMASSSLPGGPVRFSPFGSVHNQQNMSVPSASGVWPRFGAGVFSRLRNVYYKKWKDISKTI